ncbi:cytochrome c oxidase assembly protein [Intrasporangium flavum]|uniref:cytochrome c oxidase assembly protein n=1 Tax=Intrasporangium flavum TaxID=1428657 RepID=UPI0009701D6E|nr:cytochrome c oxidase assembly protein [Intrasporangium flavum]
MSSFTPTDLLTAWTLDPVGLALVLLAALPYIVLGRRSARAGLRPSGWRAALFGVVGVGSLAYAGCGALAVYRADVFWVGALRVGVLATLTPIGLALGDPVGLLRRLHPDGGHALLRFLRGRVSRALTFPAVSTGLATGTLLVVFVTPVFTWSVTSRLAGAGLDVVLLGTGLLFVVPLLGEDLLPAWATPPVRTFLAFVDGLLDAVPGIVVMTATTILSPGYPGFSSGVSGLDPLQDQRLGGGALLAVAEAVGLPVIAAVFLEWIRTDEQDARVADAEADAAQAARVAQAIRAGEGTQSGPGRAGGPVPTQDAGASGLWWEQDPRFAGRYRRAAPEAGSDADADA